MANSKISALTAATTPLAGTEVLPIVQGGVTKQVSIANLTAGRAVTMSTLAVGVASPSTTAEISGAPGTLRVSGTGGTVPQVQIVSGGVVNWSLRVNQNGGSDFTLYQDSTERILVASGGDMTLKTGDLIQGTAAKGINFSANTGAAGVTSKLLNWYEEGTWTPVLRFGGGSTGITYTTQQGRYTRIGRTVTIRFEITLSSKGSSTGEADITGLPYNAANLNAFSVYLYSNFNATYKVGIAYLNAGTINEIAANGTAAFSDTQFTNTSRFWGTCTYQV